MEWKKERDIEKVLGEISNVVSRLQKGKICGVGGTWDFHLDLRSSTKFVDKREAEIWAWNIDKIEVRAQTVSQVLRDAMTQLYKKSGLYAKHECPICHEVHNGYDISELPIDALKELIQEIVEIARTMRRREHGRLLDSPVHLKINTVVGYAQIYFGCVQDRFSADGKSSYRFFESAQKLCPIQSIDDVLSQAHQCLEQKGPHKCPICGLMH